MPSGGVHPIGMVGYLDPSSAFVGYAGAVAVNRARGGSLDDFGPAIEYFQALAENDPIVPKQTSYARVVSGEIPILLDYDFNAYRAKYTEDGSFEFVIPAEGTVVVPYVQSLVVGAPNEENGKRILDFIMSDEGQALWTNAYLRPARPHRAARRDRRALPAGRGVRACRAGGLRPHGGGASRLRRALPRRGPLRALRAGAPRPGTTAPHPPCPASTSC